MNFKGQNSISLTQPLLATQKKANTVSLYFYFYYQFISRSMKHLTHNLLQSYLSFLFTLNQPFPHFHYVPERSTSHLLQSPGSLKLEYQKQYLSQGRRKKNISCGHVRKRGGPSVCNFRKKNSVFFLLNKRKRLRMFQNGKICILLKNLVIPNLCFRPFWIF